MLREEFVAALENVETMEEVKEIFQKDGINLDEMMEAEIESEELSEDDLEDVAGGISSKQMKNILVAAFKRIKGGWRGALWGTAKDSAVLLTAYYDVMQHGNATRTFSEKEILAAAKRFGLN